MPFLWLQSLPFVKWLVGLWGRRRDEKRVAPIVTLWIECERDSYGVLWYKLVIRTDATVLDVEGEYSVNTSIEGYNTPKTRFGKPAIYASDPLRQDVLRVKSIPADEIRQKKAEITVAVFCQYKFKTGETRARYWKAELKRGNSEFEITEESGA